MKIYQKGFNYSQDGPGNILVPDDKFTSERIEKVRKEIEKTPYVKPELFMIIHSTPAEAA